MSWILALLGFSALIVLHEAGHFAAAKAVGMRVEKFYLFFPPRMTSITKGETEYGIGWIPLGGYVKITGMNPEEEIAPEVAHRAYYAQPVWKRVVVIAAGPVVNLIIAFVILFGLAFSVQQSTDKVAALEKGTPAKGVLKPGDRILTVDGRSGSPDDLRNQIATHGCADDATTQGCKAETPVVLRIERDGKTVTKKITPRYDTEAARPLVGFAFGTEPLNPSVGGAAKFSVDTMRDVTSRTFHVITRIFNAEERKQISGVVGNYEVTRQAVEVSYKQALFLLGIISLSLAIINLFPFLPLDGGHIFWAIVEKLRGRPVSFVTMERAGFVGFALVAVLFVIGLTNDIGRLTGDGFGVR
jgi:regulator of sigma E protease